MVRGVIYPRFGNRFGVMDTQPARDYSMLGKLLPELSMCLVFLWLALDPGGLLAPDPLAMQMVLMAEGASLMFFATLVDIASRVRRRPPWWAMVLVGGGLLVMYHPVISVLAMAFVAGMSVFVPLAWSLFERSREMWTLPGTSNEEKIRRRTLTFDRLWVGFVIGCAVAVYAIGQALLRDQGIEALREPVLQALVAVLFYGIAAFNAWRVHQPAFAKRPTSLVPWLDRGDGTYLSPL